MTPVRNPYQFHTDAERLRNRFLSARGVSIALAAFTAVILTWLLTSDAWKAPTPWWGHALFWFLLTAVPIVAALAINRWFSVFVAPAGIVLGAAAAFVIKDAGEIVGDFPPELAMLLWSMIALAAWTAGFAIRVAFRARRRTQNP
jgi:hypothetical protein